MKRLTLAAALLAALHLMGAAAQAALLTPTDLDALDLGVQVMPERASDFLTPDLSGQGGPVSRSIGTLDSEVDRKSTRLNSSHDQISYAVFCLKKKITHYV